MATLTGCMKKAGASLEQADRDAILSAYAAATARGVKPADAARTAVDAQIAEAESALVTMGDTLPAQDAEAVRPKAAEGMVVMEPQADYTGRYETDLFGNALPNPAGKPAGGKSAPAKDRDVQPASGVQGDTPAPDAEYFVRTIVGSEQDRKLGASRILTPADAAQATAYLYRSAVERFDGIVTDKDGKPLAVVGGFKGAVSQTSVYGATMMAEAIRVPGAARIWFSHNHPSGTATLSEADKMVNGVLSDMFEGSGIESMGIMAVAGNKFTHQGPPVDGQRQAEIVEDIPAPKSGVSVPVLDRQLVNDGADQMLIESPVAAQAYAKKAYERSGPGLMLLNSQNRVSAWMPLPSNMRGRLRGTGGLAALYRAASESNAAAAIVVHGGELGEVGNFPRSITPANNIAAALSKVDVRALDIIDVKTGSSAANQGLNVAAGPVFARTFDADLFRRMTTPMKRGMEVADVEKVIAPVLKRWKAGPKVVVVAKPADLPMDAPSDAQGVYFKGRVHLVASNIRTPDQVMRVLGHESIAHFGLREMLSKDGFRQFTNQVQLALKTGNKPLAAIQAEVRAAYVDEAGRFNLTPGQESDEIAAKVVEQAIDADGNFRPGFGFVKSVYAKIVEFLRGIGISVSFTHAELQGMLVNAQRQLETGKRTEGASEYLQPVYSVEGDMAAGNALRAMSEMDDLFELPKSSKTDLQGIANDNFEGIKIRTTNFPGGETMHTLVLPDGTGGRLTVRKSTTRSVYGASDGKEGGYDWIMGRPGENPDDVADNVEDVWIDVSTLKDGKTGAIFYNIAATFAHNTGRIFIGDPAGLSDAALRRRTEQMLSSALKFGTTDHLAPHPRQVEGDAKLKVPGLKWVYGDSEGNIKRMIDVSLKSIENAFPTSKLIGYESAGNTFYRTDTGKPFPTRGALAELVGRATGDGRGRATNGSGSAQAGWRTVARAAIYRHIQEAVRDGGVPNGRGILDRLREHVSGLRRDPASGRAYKTKERILYSRAADSLKPVGGAAKSPAAVEAEASIDRQNPPTTGQPDLFTPGFWETPQDTRTDRFIFELQDGRIDLKRVQQAIAKVGGQIREQFDARLAETLYPGRVAQRAQQFLEDEAKPLLEVMARNNVPMAELSDYLHARGAEERNAQIAKVNPDMPDGGAGKNSKGVLLTTAAARQYLAAVTPARKMVLDALAKRVDAITGGTRKLLVDEGLEKAETIASWEAAYQNYVPMFRDEAEEGRPHPTGSGMSVRGSASKRATGSTKEVTNILAHVLMQREAAITRAEKNRVAVALYGMALTNPNPDFWTTIRPGMEPEAIGRELQRMGVDPTVAEAGMKGVPTIRTVDPVLNRVVDRPNPIYKNMPGAIVLKVNGEDRVLMLNERDPRAKRMADNLKNLDGLTKIDWSVGVLHTFFPNRIPKWVGVGPATRWLASINTQFNPAFGLVNLTRDTVGGAINLSSTRLRGKSSKVLAMTPAAITGIGLELSGKKSGEWGKLWRQFQADGGQTGYREMFKDASDRTDRLQAELKSLEKAGKLTSDKVGGMVLGALDVFNTSLENAVRLAAYREALNMGMSRAESARLGRELTVDFNRKGRTGRELSPLYAFFNAAVQGSARTLQTLAGPAGAKIIAGGLTLGVMQAVMLLFAGYDDDEIPEFVKSRALIIPLGKDEEGKKKYFTIPYPLGLHVIPNTGRVLTELTLSGGEGAKDRAFEAVGEIASAFNPLGGGNIFTGDGALRTLAPSVVDPVIESFSNKNFAGSPIERESQGENDPRPGFQRAREGTMRTATGQMYTDISRIINTMTGGDAYEKGMASPSPEMVRYWTQVVGGGLLREIEKTINTSVDVAKDQPVKSSGIPVVGRFYGEVDDANVQRSRYYDNLREIETLERKIKAADKAGDVEAANRMEADGELADASRAARRAKKDIRDLNTEAMETIGDGAALRALDAERTEVMRDLNIEADEIRKEKRGPTPGDRLKQAVGVASP